MNVSAELLRLGLPGLVILGLVYWVKRLDSRLEISYEQRLNDQRSHQAQLLDLAKSMISVITNANTGQDATRAALKEMKDTFQELSKNIPGRR